MSLPDLAGRVCLVTGATSGIGRATAEGLARLNATVLVVARDRDRGEATLDALRRLTPHVALYLADLASQASLAALAEAVMADHRELHVLVNNAGAVFPDWQLTEDGLERTFAINAMAPFLLSRLLLPALRAGAPARIVNVASNLHRLGRCDVDDPQGMRHRDMLGAYARSKLACVMTTVELAGRLAGTGVTANCLHPGVVASNINRHATGPMALAARLLSHMPWVLSSEAGAATSLYLAAMPEVAGVTGRYFERCRPARMAARAEAPLARRRLWEACELLARVPLGAL